MSEFDDAITGRILALHRDLAAARADADMGALADMARIESELTDLVRLQGEHTG